MDTEEKVCDTAPMETTNTAGSVQSSDEEEEAVTVKGMITCDSI